MEDKVKQYGNENVNSSVSADPPVKLSSHRSVSLEKQNRHELGKPPAHQYIQKPIIPKCKKGTEVLDGDYSGGIKQKHKSRDFSLLHGSIPNFVPLLKRTDWRYVPQVKSGENKINNPIEYDTETWINDCQRSLEKYQLPLVPMVAAGNNHQLVQILFLKRHTIYIGISFKYTDPTLISGFMRYHYEGFPVDLYGIVESFHGVGWTVTAIYLDIMEICKRYRSRVMGLSKKEILKCRNMLKVSGINFCKS